MTWLRFDDKRGMHRKLRAAGFAATGLDSAAICMSGADETDGFIDDDTLAILAAGYKERQVKRLTDILCSPNVDRWVRDEKRGGYWIKDYLHYNPSHAELEAKREADRQRKRKGSDSDSSSDHAGSDEDSNGIPTGSDEDSINGSKPPRTRATRDTIPTHPDPSKKERASRKTPISSGALPDDLRQWAHDNGYGHINLDTFWQQLVDWHRKEAKLSADWAATWRTWLRKETPQVQVISPETREQRATRERRQRLKSTLAAAKLAGDTDLETETLASLEASA